MLESDSILLDGTNNFTREWALEQAGAGLERLMAGSLRRAPAADAPLLAWPLVCGSVVAERTRAISFSDKVLQVEVPDAGWKREMQNLASRYLAGMNRYAGQKIERIEFVIRQENQGNLQSPSAPNRLQK
jgi:hypothetical protein